MTFPFSWTTRSGHNVTAHSPQAGYYKFQVLDAGGNTHDVVYPLAGSAHKEYPFNTERLNPVALEVIMEFGFKLNR